KIWDARTGEQVLALDDPSAPVSDGSSAPVSAIHFSADGRWIVTTTSGHNAQFWDAGTGRQAFVLAGDFRAFSPDYQRIMTYSADGTTRFWEATTGRELLSLRRPSGAVFSPD